MDQPTAHRPHPAKAWQPAEGAQFALVLQGGGALGAYQAGVYQALHEAGIEPDWVCGVSIGAINCAIIAGNPRERRLERLRTFWERITESPVVLPSLMEFLPAWANGDNMRKARNAAAAHNTLTFGQPGFFKPNHPGPLFRARGAADATSFYDTAPLRDTLQDLVDFDLLNAGETRFAVGAVNVGSGNFVYFDTDNREITPEHVMASGALPPGLPMVRIGTDYFWDGGIVSNTPLQHLMEHVERDVLVFQVDLFNARGPIPRDIYDVVGRAKDIQYSSRTRLITDMFGQIHGLRTKIRDLLDRLPTNLLTAEDRQLQLKLANLPRATILHMIYQQEAYEGQSRDFEFSRASMLEHWEAGLRDTTATLRRREWLNLPDAETGVLVHDVHQAWM
jgi:NTE family protein